jgi:hypothetical protein
MNCATKFVIVEEVKSVENEEVEVLVQMVSLLFPTVGNLICLSLIWGVAWVVLPEVPEKDTWLSSSGGKYAPAKTLLVLSLPLHQSNTQHHQPFPTSRYSPII